MTTHEQLLAARSALPSLALSTGAERSLALMRMADAL